MTDTTQKARVIFEGRMYTLLSEDGLQLQQLRKDGREVKPSNAAYAKIAPHASAILAGALPEGFAPHTKSELLQVLPTGERTKRMRHKNGRYMPISVMPPKMARAVDLLLQAGYAPTAAACIKRAVEDASKNMLRRMKAAAATTDK